MSVTNASDPGEQAGGVSGIRIAYALFGGIFAWMAHLIAQAGVNGWVCETGSLWLFHVITVATLLPTFHALWVSVGIARDDTPSPSVRAAQLLGWIAIAVNVWNAVLIVLEWVPVFVIHPCSFG